VCEEMSTQTSISCRNVIEIKIISDEGKLRAFVTRTILKESQMKFSEQEGYEDRIKGRKNTNSKNMN
jgi:acetyl-CoA carboxylase beta subunit